MTNKKRLDGPAPITNLTYEGSLWHTEAPDVDRTWSEIEFVDVLPELRRLTYGAFCNVGLDTIQAMKAEYEETGRPVRWYKPFSTRARSA